MVIWKRKTVKQTKINLKKTFIIEKHKVYFVYLRSYTDSIGIFSRIEIDFEHFQFNFSWKFTSVI